MPIEENYNQCIFSILLKKDDTHLVHLGTGFLIGLNGLFFTAGHTFRKIKESEIDKNGYSNIFIGFPSDNSALYKLKKLYYFSLPIYLQKGPTYYDACAGIIDFTNSKFLIFNRKRPKIGETHVAIGLKNNNETRLHELRNNNTADLSGIRLINTTVIVSKYYPCISDLERDYTNPVGDVSSSKFFNNCIELNTILSKGESGCPIIDELGLISGVFIASSEFTKTSVMIASKFCTKVIKYKTNFQYDTYQDLKYRNHPK